MQCVVYIYDKNKLGNNISDYSYGVPNVRNRISPAHPSSISRSLSFQSPFRVLFFNLSIRSS